MSESPTMDLSTLPLSSKLLEIRKYIIVSATTTVKELLRPKSKPKILLNLAMEKIVVKAKATNNDRTPLSKKLFLQARYPEDITPRSQETRPIPATMTKSIILFNSRGLEVPVIKNRGKRKIPTYRAHRLILL